MGSAESVDTGQSVQASFLVAGVQDKHFVNFLPSVVPKQFRILNPLAPGVPIRDRAPVIPSS